MSNKEAELLWSVRSHVGKAKCRAGGSRSGSTLPFTEDAMKVQRSEVTFRDGGRAGNQQAPA